MTYEEFLTQVKEDGATRDAIKDIMEEFDNTGKYISRDNTANKVRNSPTTVSVFCLQVFAQINDYYPLGYANRDLTAGSGAAIATKAGFTLPSHSALHDFELDDIKDLMIRLVLNKERARRNDVKFNITAKELKLDGFSYAVFEQYINQLKKKLSGKDAERYLSNMPKVSILTEDETKYYSMYMKLLYENVKTKSIAFSKKIIDNSSYIRDVTKDLLAFDFIDRPITDDTGTWASRVHFTFRFFEILSNSSGIPLKVSAYYISESQVHPYITGTPKKNPMTKWDVIYAIDKITLLTYAKQQDKFNCPYYDMAIDQLVEELKNEKVIEILNNQLTHNAKASEATITATATLTKIIKEN
jgi:hypothetical protein